MKKMMIIGIFAIILSGCTFSSSETSRINKQVNAIEKEARITILMDDEVYAQKIEALWNETYPQFEGTLEIMVEPYHKKKDIKYDIEWIKDVDVYKRKKLYKLSNKTETLETNVEEHLQKDKEYFMPVEGKGMVFVYNEKKLQKLAPNIKKLTQFEQLEGLNDHIYYHNRDTEYVYPFLFTLQKNGIQDWLEGDALYKNIATYRQLNKKLSLYNDIINKDFLNSDSYLCGLIQNDLSYQKTTAYKQGDLKFTSMPTYQGKKFSPIIDTYGFVINKSVKYPKAANTFIQLVRSKKGMETLIKYTDKTALIEHDDFDKIEIYDSCRKDVMNAMNGSQLRDSALEDKLNQSNFFSIIQNSLFTNESNKTIWRKIKRDLT